MDQIVAVFEGKQGPAFNYIRLYPNDRNRKYKSLSSKPSIVTTKCVEGIYYEKAGPRDLVQRLACRKPETETHWQQQVLGRT
jgi:hypothetical protein